MPKLPIDRIRLNLAIVEHRQLYGQLIELDRRVAMNVEVDPYCQCWRWLLAITSDGYGLVSVTTNGRKSTRLIHRHVYQLLVDPIPPRYVLDHLRADRRRDPGPCLYRDCCNPAHLEPVTVALNGARVESWQRKKTHCPEGHSYVEYGVRYVCKDGTTRRYCAACGKAPLAEAPINKVAS